MCFFHAKAYKFNKDSRLNDHGALFHTGYIIRCKSIMVLDFRLSHQPTRKGPAGSDAIRSK